MKLFHTALVLLLSLCSISAAAVLPNSSPAIAKPTTPAVRPYSPTHGTCFILLGIVEKKPHSVIDRESTAWVSLWDGATKEFKGLTWGDGEPVRGIVTAHSIDGDPSSEALRIHGLFSPTDCFSIKWINPSPGSHQEWTAFNYSGSMVGDVEFDDTDKHWDVATCNRTAWTDTEWDQYSTDRITRCWFKCQALVLETHSLCGEKVKRQDDVRVYLETYTVPAPGVYVRFSIAVVTTNTTSDHTSSAVEIASYT